jgi:hypothetical protein
MCVVVAGCTGPALAPSAARVVSPPAAATFIAAHAAGAAAGAEHAMSPLHRAELARRGRGPAASVDPLWAAAAPLLDFEAAAVISGGHGFVHALYVARPRRSPATGPTSVWRVDLDPLGRVVWGEPVRLLADPSAVVVGAGATPSPVVAALGTLRPPHGVRLGAPVGVRSAAGDGYYGLALRRPGQPEAVMFVIVDEEGAAGPDRWSFGQPVPLGDPDDHHALAPPWGSWLDGMPPADRDLLRAYLAALGPRVRFPDAQTHTGQTPVP